MTFGSPLSVPIAADEVAIGITHGAFGSHTGIVFQSAKDGQQLLHLRWHKLLGVDNFPTSDACWIVCKPELPPILRKHVVGIVRAVAKRRPQIAYAVDSIAGKGSFDANGSYKPPKGSLGLTCASFVTEIFRAAKVPLLNESTWIPTPANRQWAEDVIALLMKHGADASHVASVRASINGIRIRPEEVGAAAPVPFASRPIDFNTASLAAPSVIDVLHRWCPVGLPSEDAGQTANSPSTATAGDEEGSRKEGDCSND